MNSSSVWLLLPLFALSCSSDTSSDGPGSAGTGGSEGEATTPNMAGEASNTTALPLTPEQTTGGGSSEQQEVGSRDSSNTGAGNSSAGGSTGMPQTDAGFSEASEATDAGASPDAGSDDSEDSATLDDGSMTFFVTSDGMGDGGDLGGLTGADAFCQQLAEAQSDDFARRTWHAYLSTTTVDAIDRIGTGPWRNANGDIIANSLEQLHDTANEAAGGPLDATWAINDFSIPLDETGAQVPNNRHDILTGTLTDGTAAEGLNCVDWTSSEDSQNVQARVGHTNRTGLAGQRQLWHNVHEVGCSQDGNSNVTQGGGRGSFYCFAVITGQ